MLSALVLTSIILIAELVGGYLANSLALLSDAGHVFTDVLALLLSWFAIKQAEKPATRRMTYGYHRVGILVALINALTLIAIAVAIFYEAYQRFMKPEPVASLLMLAVALVGLTVNLVVMLSLKDDTEGSLNVRSVFLHVIGDALASVGVIAGGAIIYFTNWFWIDPAISVGIGLIIAFGSWQIIKEAVSIFLEASPLHLDMGEVEQAMLSVLGVREVHDLHIWTIAPQMHALSSHVLVDDQSISDSGRIIGDLRTMLLNKFNIGHTTLQFECKNCGPGLLCTLENNSHSTLHGNAPDHEREHADTVIKG